MNQARTGIYSESGIVAMVWIMERRHKREDVVIVENVPCSSTLEALLREMLSDLYSMSSLLLGPQDLGWLASRARRFFVFVLREGRVRLTAPFDTLKRIFRRAIPSSGLGAD
eukprot:12433712-Alexandrium_andersonii.AAC.1